ncbi:ribonuclease H-like protein [Poronia punctata]|nr:ribonuclease H-like protein [Poronia punctata]
MDSCGAPVLFNGNSGLIDTTPGIALMVDEIYNLPCSPPSLYIDLEGVNLSRHGTLSILQIHVRTTSQNYLVDIKTLGHEAFLTPGMHSATTVTLKSILESRTIPKVFFDVRCDSDALFSHYNIRLQGIQDLQLMEFATRQTRKSFISGLKKCIDMDLPMTEKERRDWMTVKDDGVKLFAPEKGGSYEVFNQRPLPDKIRAYCIQDVHFLPRLWDFYNRKLSPAWRAKVADATEARVEQSQGRDFNPVGKHMTLPPAGWTPHLLDYQREG